VCVCMSALWSTSRLSTRAVTFHALHVTLGRYHVCVCVCVCVWVYVYVCVYVCVCVYEFIVEYLKAQY